MPYTYSQSGSGGSFTSIPTNGLDIPAGYYQVVPQGYDTHDVVANPPVEPGHQALWSIPNQTAVAVPFVLKHNTVIEKVGGFMLSFNPGATTNRYYALYNTDVNNKPTTRIVAASAVATTGAGPILDGATIADTTLIAGTVYCALFSCNRVTHATGEFNTLLGLNNALATHAPSTDANGWLNILDPGCYQSTLATAGFADKADLSGLTWTAMHGIPLMIKAKA